MKKSFYILTGATSGMGLHIAQALSRERNAVIVVGVRNTKNVGALRSAVDAKQLLVRQLDLDSLASVSAFAELLLSELPENAELSSVICNAGLQLVGKKEMVTPKIERTFLVNYLGHFHLVELLLPHLKKGGSVVTVGSGTHNPADKIAKKFDFRGGPFPDAERVARGDLGTTGKEMLLGMDRYATSKLCAIYHAVAMAEEVAPEQVRFYSFDPGLMPGTGLARDRSAIERFGWRYIVPHLRHLISGISTPEQSANSMVKNCVEGKQFPSGSYVEFTGKHAPRSEVSLDLATAQSLVKYSRDLLAELQ